VRRVTIPAALISPTSTIAPTPTSTVAVAMCPSSKRGMITWSMTLPSTYDDPTVASAYTAAPKTAVANGRKCSDTSSRSTRSPRRSSRPVVTGTSMVVVEAKIFQPTGGSGVRIP
jgi:hypothetical protein